MKNQRILALAALPLLALLAACQSASAGSEGSRRIGLLLASEGFDPKTMTLPEAVTPQSAVKVLDVEPGSPADRAGFKKDDLIFKYDGTYLKDASMLMELAIRRSVKSEVDIDVARGTKFLTLKLQLEGSQPKSLNLLLFSQSNNDFFNAMDILWVIYNQRVSREYRLFRFNILYERKTTGSYGHHRFLYFLKFKTGEPAPIWL
ncbi:MAG: PDZ domain-containing protein [Planctomycetota bacterium]